MDKYDIYKFFIVGAGILVLIFLSFQFLNKLESLEQYEAYCESKNYVWNGLNCFKEQPDGTYKKIEIQKASGKIIEVVKWKITLNFLEFL